MKAVRTAVVLIVMMQLFGLVAGVSYLSLFSIWIATWLGSFIESIFTITWDEYVRDMVKEKRRWKQQ